MIIILNASYFAGMFWLIFCELTLYFNKNDAYLNSEKLYEKYSTLEDDCKYYPKKVAEKFVDICFQLAQDKKMLEDTRFFLSYY
jgi:hypothetical protein